MLDSEFTEEYSDLTAILGHERIAVCNTGNIKAINN